MMLIYLQTIFLELCTTVKVCLVNESRDNRASGSNLRNNINPPNQNEYHSKWDQLLQDPDDTRV